MGAGAGEGIVSPKVANKLQLAGEKQGTHQFIYTEPWTGRAWGGTGLGSRGGGGVPSAQAGLTSACCTPVVRCGAHELELMNLAVRDETLVLLPARSMGLVTLILKPAHGATKCCVEEF